MRFTIVAVVALGMLGVAEAENGDELQMEQMDNSVMKLTINDIDTTEIRQPKKRPRAKTLTQYESATLQAGHSTSFTSILTSVWTHSRNEFLYVFSDADPIPSFISYSLTSISSPPGYDYAHVLGGQIYAEDGTYLGVVSSNKYSSDSITNTFGSYGSKYSSTSIKNEFGSYGSPYASQSAYNKYSSSPPVIYVGSTAVCYLSTNTFRSPRCDPDELFSYLAGDAPGGFPTVRHSIEVNSTAPAGTYEFPVIFGFYSEGDASNLIGAEAVWFSITVQSANSSPILSNIGNKSVAEGAELRFTLFASDPDGDALTYSGSMSPSASGPTLSSTSGIFSWTPNSSQSGSYTATFTVADGKGGSDSETITITVANVNQPPVLSTVGSRTISEGSALNINLSASDADGNNLTYSVSGNPSGSSLSGNTFSWTPTSTQSGSYTVTFTVDDGVGSSDSETITISVTDKNLSPVLSAIGDQTVSEGNALNLTLSASDPDGDSVTYSVSGNASGSSLSGSNFNWTPTLDQSGTYAITFTANDSNGGSDSETIHITVTNTNQPPILTLIGDQTVLEGSALNLTLSATDEDGDNLTYSISNTPSGSSLSGNTFSWTPTNAQSGSYTVTFAVDDGVGNSDSETITIMVTDKNLPPVLSAIGDRTALEGSALTITLSASDEDGDDLVYSVSNSPDGASISNNEFSWTPTSTQDGSYDITFTVDDGRGGSDSEMISITVTDVNLPPIISAIADQVVMEGETITITLSAVDPDNDDLTYSLLDLPLGAVLQDSVFSWTPEFDRAGDYNLSFSIADGKGGEASATVAVVVRDINRPPIFQAIDGLKVAPNEELELRVSAHDPDGDSVKLSVPDSPDGSQLVDSVFTWIPHVTDIGLSTLRFVAVDSGGASDTLDVEISVEANGPIASLIEMDLDPESGNQALKGADIADGETIEIEFHYIGDANITGFGLTLEFDADVIELKVGEFTSNIGPAANVLPLAVLSGSVAQLGAVNTDGRIIENKQICTIPILLNLELEGPTVVTLSQIILKFDDRSDLQLAVNEQITISPRLVTGDFDGNGVVDFVDFFSFADAFGAPSFDPRYDLNGDGEVSFLDFFMFADFFSSNERAKLMILAERLIGLPTRTLLSQNFPNPFNSDTSISYSIGSPGYIELSVYDLNGQRVKSLTKKHHAPGQYQLSWDGTNSAGIQVSSGTYLLQIQSETSTDTRKMMLVK